MAAANWWDPDDWEIVNDDGFVYKRRKRPRIDPTTTAPPDPAVEEKNRRERKKRAILKIKTRYQNEIDRWEQMANTLNAIQENAQNQSDRGASISPALPPEPVPEQPSNSTSNQLVDELLSQAEAQEAILQDISKLCDVADALCDAHEERWKTPFLDLPIWEVSPRELIKSLCEEE